MKNVILLTISLNFLFGCAVPLSPAAEKIELISANQKEKCERVKLISFNQSLGPDKPGNALKGALNEAAMAGADSFYIVSSTSHAFDGASVIGEAFRCKSKS